MKAFFRASVRTQIAVMTILLAAAVTCLGVMAEPLMQGRFEKGLEVGSMVERVASIASEFDNASTTAQEDAILSQARGGGLEVERAGNDALSNAQVSLANVRETVRRFLDPNIFFESNEFFQSGDKAVLVVGLSEGRGLEFHLTRFTATQWILPAVLGHLTLIIVPPTILAFLSAALIGRPIVKFAAAAERIATDEALDEPFQSDGTAELRSLAGSLNVMRERVRELMAARTSMLTSISHDLRTPLTRLRMRAERCDQDDLRQKMLKDIEILGGMIDESLSFLDGTLEATKKVELSSLLQTAVSDFRDIGIEVTFHGPRRLIYDCKPRAISRVVANLVDNASRYADNIGVLLAQAPDGSVVISVADDGSGISDTLKAQMVKPFVKADKARSMSKGGGFGLGLSIAHEIITKGHRGRFELCDRHPHGLAVVMTLPPHENGVAGMS